MATTVCSSAAVLLVLLLVLAGAEVTSHETRIVRENSWLMHRAVGSAEWPNELHSNEYCKCNVSDKSEIPNDLVICSQKQVQVQECYCVTYDNDATVVGPCFVGCLVQPFNTILL